jgi:DNA-binding Lrp family transcriptional regulator
LARLEASGQPKFSKGKVAAELGISLDAARHVLRSLQDAGGISIEDHSIVINKTVLERISMEATLARTYVLLKTTADNLERTIEIVRRQPGVVTADQVEGAADAIFTVQAPDRESLAELTVRAIASVEDMTEDVQLLPIRD